MSKWNLKVRKVTNGFILVTKDTLLDDEEIEVEEVYPFITDEQSTEDFRTEDEEKQALGHLLYGIAHELGYSYDGFSSENLAISFDLKGDEI